MISFAGSDHLAEKYIGCFQDGHTRDLIKFEIDYTDMSVEGCVSRCLEKGYLFAGAQVRKNLLL